MKTKTTLLKNLIVTAVFMLFSVSLTAQMPQPTVTIDVSNPASVPGANFASNVYTFTTAANTNVYRITGTSTTVRLVVSTDVNTTLIFDNVDITHATLSPLELMGNAVVTAWIADETTNTFRCNGILSYSAYTSAVENANTSGIQVSQGTSLILNGTTGILNVHAIIGSIGNMGCGAGIGGANKNGTRVAPGSSGDITINGGIINVTSGVGAAIGGSAARYNNSSSGSGADGGTITINGGIVTANAVNNVGIGGGATGGNGGIGGNDANGGNGGTINITGGTIIASGIGGGSSNNSNPINPSVVNTRGGNSGNITISNATVTSTSEWNAGIGGGRAVFGSSGNVDVITINSGTIIAISERNIGIGGGTGGTVIINGGNVTAVSLGSVGIGNNALQGIGVNLTISPTATVKAYSTRRGAIDASNANVGSHIVNAGFYSSMPNASTIDVYYFDGPNAGKPVLEEDGVTPIRLQLTFGRDLSNYAFTTGNTAITTSSVFTNGTNGTQNLIVRTANSATTNTSTHDTHDIVSSTDPTWRQVWLRSIWTVTFNSNGGSPVNNQAVPQGGTVIRPIDPTKGDDTFLGWFTLDGTNTGNWGTEWNFATGTVTGNMTLHAQWAVPVDCSAEIPLNVAVSSVGAVTFTSEVSAGLGSSVATKGFQYRVRGTEIWTNIPTPGSFTTDLNTLSTGTYEVRAYVATSIECGTLYSRTNQLIVVCDGCE